MGYQRAWSALARFILHRFHVTLVIRERSTPLNDCKDGGLSRPILRKGGASASQDERRIFLILVYQKHKSHVTSKRRTADLLALHTAWERNECLDERPSCLAYRSTSGPSPEISRSFIGALGLYLKTEMQVESRNVEVRKEGSQLGI